MLSRLPATILAATVATVAADVTGPFALQIIGKEDASIDGYAGACHAGAGIEALCYADGPVDGNSFEWYFNTTSSSSSGQPGYLTWILPLGGDQAGTGVPSAVQLSGGGWGTNVVPAMVYPGLQGGTNFYYSADNGTVYLPGGYDDSAFNDTRPAPPPYLGDLTRFYLCYQYTGGYYYRSIAWVAVPPPRNPSCVPVDLRVQTLEPARSPA
ncbi:hypothetical protein GGS23DRAFT_595737 [Durotheca rogersii]|uniref:uncharacterized protein n=1 Tax=Durotheca rogersii TaxID=419775 RepID=UPI00221FEF9A|nr:uncharacterized protein GGS23DRAFT_595737 [Durotheca rogersii]KAI5864086.1 hypothetical protein GGS23DRAFT_595737 [Durotheca rogersii]